MTWPEKTAPNASDKRTLGEGVFSKCAGCGATVEKGVLDESFQVCPHCQHHHRLDALGWQQLMLDDGVLEVWDADLAPADPLEFTDDKPYAMRLAASQQKTGSLDAVVSGLGRIDGRTVAYGSFIFAFMGGSMGSVVGERIARLFERAADQRLPVVLLQASGGARMQEGILSLMQMAKTVSALERLRSRSLPFVSCLLHPTTGGVAASFAFLGDVNIAEQDALIGFAGPRVIENTIRQTLPDGFQRADFLLDHGMVDMVCSRLEMKTRVASVFSHLSPE